MKNERRMTVRLGDIEDEVIRGVASALGVTDSEAVRLAILALADRLPVGVAERVAAPPVPPEVVEMKCSLDRLVAEVQRVGVNVNQIVRACHVNGWTDEDLSGLCEVLVTVSELVDHVREVVNDVGK